MIIPCKLSKTNILIHSLLFITISFSLLWTQENLKFDIKSFSESVIQHNLELKAANLTPEVLYETYAQQKSQNYASRLNVSYQTSPLARNNQPVSDFRAAWTTNFLSGTSLSVGLSNQVTELTAGPTTITNWTSAAPTLSLSQNILNGALKGYNQKVLDSTLYNARAGDANFRFQVSSTLYNALLTYHQFLINQELIKLYTEDLKDVREIFKFNQRKSRLGTLAERNLLSSEILTIETELSLETVRNSNQQLENNLIVFIGKSPSQDYTLTLSDSILSNKPVTNSQTAVQSALDHREDYKALLIQLQGARNNLTVAKLTRLPNLDLSVSTTLYGIGDSLSSSYNNIDPANVDNYNLTIGVNFNAFTDNKWYKSATATRKLQIDQTALQLEQLKQAIETQIANNLITINKNSKLYQRTRKILELTRKRYAVTREEYFNGRIDFETNVNVKRELFRARTTYLNSKFNYEVSLLEYEYLTGRFNSLYAIEKLRRKHKLDDREQETVASN